MAGSGDGNYIIGPREFSLTLEVEAETSEEAENPAREAIENAIDYERNPG